MLWVCEPILPVLQTLAQQRSKLLDMLTFYQFFVDAFAQSFHICSMDQEFTRYKLDPSQLKMNLFHLQYLEIKSIESVVFTISSNQVKRL